MEEFEYFDLDGLEDTVSSITLTKEQQKQRQIEALSKTQAAINGLEWERLQILKGLADVEKNNKLYAAVSRAHKGILDIDGELVDILKDCFSDDLDALEFLLKHRHDRFYKAKTVFEEHLEHPKQKELIKTKNVNIRGAKKNKTAQQHMTYMHTGKKNMNMQQQLDDLQRRLALNEQLTTNIIAQQTMLTDSLVSTQNDVKDIISKLSGKITDTRKVSAYTVHKSDPSVTHSALAKMFGVQRRTIIRWLNEVKETLSDTESEV